MANRTKPGTEIIDRAAKATRDLWAVLDDGQVFTTDQFAALADLSKGNAGSTRLLLEAVGAIKTDISFNGRGKQSRWTRLVGADEAERRVREWLASHYLHELKTAHPLHDPFNRGTTKPVAAKPEPLAPPVATKPEPVATKPEPVVLAPERSTEEVRAIAGPEPVKPLVAAGLRRGPDEIGALIEAARQYAGRKDGLDRKIRELEELGLDIDHEALSKAIRWHTDERLEAVAVLLPYITRLENVNARLANEVADSRGLRSEKEALEVQVRRQRENIERLVGQKTALAARAAGA